MSDRYEKREPTDNIWWLITDEKGPFIFSFDKKKNYNLFQDYPHALTKKQLKIFDQENPFWAEFFEDRKHGK